MCACSQSDMLFQNWVAWLKWSEKLTATEAEIDLGLELLDAALEQTLDNLHPVREAPVFAAVVRAR
jgi:hypothetical protein